MFMVGLRGSPTKGLLAGGLVLGVGSVVLLVGHLARLRALGCGEYLPMPRLLVTSLCGVVLASAVVVLVTVVSA